MAKTLQQILGYENLTGMVQDPRGGLPADVIPAAFMDASASVKVEGNTSSYLKVEGNRQTARTIQYGGKSVRAGHKAATRVPVVLMHSHEHIEHQMATLMNLRQFDNPAAQELGQQEIDRQTVAFRSRFNNLRLASVFSMLALGKIYFDADGNLLPSSSGAATTVDMKIPSGNQSQLDVEGNGDLIDASWAVAGTDILQHVNDIRDALERRYGFTIKHCFYGANILKYLLANTDVTNLMQSDSSLAANLRMGNIPDGFAVDGLSWHRATRAFFEDHNGANQTLFGDDTVVFTPEVSPEWYEWQEGSMAVPTDLGRVGGDAVEMLENIAKVYGMFNYAKVNDDPVCIEHHGGDTFLPIIKVPGAIAIGDVTP